MTRIKGTEWDRATCATEAASRVRAGELSEPDNHSLDFALWALELLKENDCLRAERFATAEEVIVVTDPHRDICTWPIDGRAPGTAALPCNRTDCPYCRARVAPPAGWRLGVTFPVELEENEAAAIEEELRKKFMPERFKELPGAAERLLGKMRRVLNKFCDKRRADEELADSLTDEERQIIRDRRDAMDKKAK